MPDIVPSEVDKGFTPEINKKPESPFYEGISSNRLYFHGTGDVENLESILDNGLEPPKYAFTKDTLARKISFTDFERYSGYNGFILGIKPENGEIEEKPAQFAREVRINSDLDRLPPERAIFYLPGSSRLPRTVFNQVKQDVGEYFEAGFNNELLLDKLNQLVRQTEEGLKSEAQILIKNNPEHIHLIAQEIVWNELCGYASGQYSQLEFETENITKIREKQVIRTSDQLVSATKDVSDFWKFDLKNYLNNLRFLSDIGNIKGLGFEGLSYPVNGQIEEVGKWLISLQANENKIGNRLIARLRGMGKN